MGSFINSGTITLIFSTVGNKKKNNMLEFLRNFENINSILRIFTTLIIAVVVYIGVSFFLSYTKRKLLKKARTKKQISNIKIFEKILNYSVLAILIIFVIFSYSGSWTGFGLSIGLFSAALGWALQKPITGVAAWIMIVIKRPFELGDRVIIGNVRGDVVDITLTHIYLREIGGIIGGEENSGRIILVPNSILFEQNIINYTLQYECILDQVSLLVTYESNLDKAIEIVITAAKKFTKEVIETTNKAPYVRTYFDVNGMRILVRYLAPAKQIQEVSSNISKEIYQEIKKTKEVEIAYPHTEVLIRRK